MTLKSVIEKHNAMDEDGGIIVKKKLIEGNFFRFNQDLGDIHDGSFVMEFYLKKP